MQNNPQTSSKSKSLSQSSTHPKLKQVFIAYGQYHDNSVNKVIHIIFIPLISITLVSLLNMIPIHYNYQSFDIRVGHVLLLSVFVYYASMHLLLGLITSVASIAIGYAWYDYFAQWTYQEMFYCVLGIHVCSWIFQFIGHGVFQKRKPALLDSFGQIFSAPMFVLLQVLMILGIGKKEWFEWNSEIKQRVKIFREKSKQKA